MFKMSRTMGIEVKFYPKRKQTFSFAISCDTADHILYFAHKQVSFTILYRPPIISLQQQRILILSSPFSSSYVVPSFFPPTRSFFSIEKQPISMSLNAHCCLLLVALFFCILSQKRKRKRRIKCKYACVVWKE